MSPIWGWEPRVGVEGLRFYAQPLSCLGFIGFRLCRIQGLGCLGYLGCRPLGV